MVLIVVAHVECDPIDRAVITERLLLGIERVMLRHPARTDGMQPDRKEKRTGEIPEAAPAAKIDDADIVGGGAEHVHYCPAAPHRDGPQTQWTRQLEKRKEEQPERFAEPFVADETRFPLIRNVRVRFVIALVSVMLEVVDDETYGAGEEIRQVGHDR